MIRKLYISAWILWASAAFVSIFTGSFNPVTLFVFSLVALALVYSLALWSAIVNTGEHQNVY